MTAVEPRAAGTMAELLRRLDDLNGTQVRGAPAAGTVTVSFPSGELEAAVHRLAGPGGARLADMFAAGGDAVTLRLVWGIDGGSAAAPRYLVTESVVDGQRYPALSDIAPAAFVEECEIYEQFGIRPATGKPMNRVMLPPHDGAELPRLGHRPERPSEDGHAPHTVGGQAFESRSARSARPASRPCTTA